VGLAAGSEFNCALISGGTVQCWGDNTEGEVGNGVMLPTRVNTAVLTPVSVSGLTGATGVAAGYSDACALLYDGTVKCWGNNISGELGNGPITSSSLPVDVSVTGATAIAAGGANCALLSDGTFECWGGAVATGTAMDALTPVQVSNLSGVAAIAAGASHTCALLLGGTVECWGSNADGQLGYPTTATCWNGIPCSLAPMAVSNLKNVTAVAAGRDHTCALLSDGTVECWGRNDYGQLGNGTMTNSATPVVVSNLAGVTAIAAGDSHNCATLVGGTIKCWGWNGSGQLGNGTTIDSAMPVTVSL
jgi:alpha-tubulin suppressor-like RCC1 family protein